MSDRGEKSWVFVFNIMVPGPPFLSFVAYFLAVRELFIVFEYLVALLTLPCTVGQVENV